VNDGATYGTLFSVGFDLGHQVMANFTLDFLSARNVDFILMRPQISHLFSSH